MLKKAYGDEQMTQASFYWWFNRFSEGNEQVEDEPRSGAQGRKHSGSAKVYDTRLLNVHEDDI